MKYLKGWYSHIVIIFISSTLIRIKKPNTLIRMNIFNIMHVFNLTRGLNRILILDLDR